MSHLSVAKFGGTSVANFDAMTSCANIVTSDANTRVVVLSASAGVTNYLVELANGCEKERREEILDAVRTIQYNIMKNYKIKVKFPLKSTNYYNISPH
ncbi:aspartate kinase III [Actinobacillus pleuropneumoniae]|nr:aspartate kinase III [Actinobacillus pleuropneumoniae]